MPPLRIPTRPPGRWVGFLALLVGGQLALVAGCQKPADAPPAPPPPTVTVAAPVRWKVQPYYEYNGYLEAIEAVEIRARVKGYLNDVLFKEGDEVAAGTKLYAIDPREYQSSVAKSKADIARAIADAANAAAQAKLAQAELTRLQAAGTAVTASEAERAAATVASNEAQVDVAKANRASAEAALRTAELQLSYTDIRAPIAGRISRTLVTRGNLVGQSDATLLTTIVSVDPLYVYFDAPEADLVAYQRELQISKQTAPTSIPVLVGVATEEGYPHEGTIDFRENRVDTGTGTVRVRGRVPNPVVAAGTVRVLYPGLFARVKVPNGPAREQLVLPEEALMTGQEGRYVYVVGPDNVVQKRTVAVGTLVWRSPPPPLPGEPTPPGWAMTNPNPKPPPAPPPGAPAAPPPPTTLPARTVVAIEKGLKPDDRVIVVGLQKARPGAPVTPEQWTVTPPPAAGAK